VALAGDNVNGLRLLHLTDLHIAEDGSVCTTLDDKLGYLDLVQHLQPRATDDLITRIAAACGSTEDLWPRAIIISGDLVNFGGGRTQREFDSAIAFIERLRERFKIEAKRVFLVPGNHDVNWTAGLDYLERFKNFIEATKSYSRPTITDFRQTPLVTTELSKIKAGIDIELCLLASPTFSGIAHPENARIIARLRKLLGDLDADQFRIIEELITRGTGTVDIAAVGQHQRDLIPQEPQPDTIRIAVLHHHLLPDPNIEITQFETVIDAGAVLQKLIDAKYDLVLSGHKHHRRLVHYECDDERLDVYSAASAFVPGTNQTPEFTLIDVFGHASPHYAELRAYSAAAANPKPTAVTKLVRRDQVLPDLLSVTRSLPQEVQRGVALPLLKAIDHGFEWRRGFLTTHTNPRAGVLFEELFEAVLGDHVGGVVELGSARRFVFRGVRVYDYWATLLRLAEECGIDSIRVVSDDDLDFWLESRKRHTDAFKYAEPLQRFSGTKTRILVLPRALADPSSERLRWALTGMHQDGFRVEIVHKEDVPRSVSVDFGLIGSLAVSRFKDLRSPTEGRSLEEAFGDDAIRRAESDWRALSALVRWRSDDAGNTEA
jgi:3',5'-cyclic AMP phosphodiesterase CpdA